MRIGSQTANIHANASVESETTSQALLGERVKVLKVQSHWSQIKLQNDGYVGYIENHHLTNYLNTSTHRVSNKLTPLFDQADIKSPVRQLATIASELVLHECNSDQFWRTDQQLYVWKQHTQTIDDYRVGQLIDTAQALFLGSPYLWGGRSPLGLDCSALVQLSALLHGWQLPRDTIDQVALFRAIHNSENLATHAIIGTESKNTPFNLSSGSVQLIDYAQKQTNDLIYWPGHVAIALDTQTVVHATAHSLQCCAEPLSEVEARAGVPDSIWRLTS